MSCPTAALLRAHIDVADAGVAAHVADCADCAARAEELAQDARFAARSVATLDGDVVTTGDIDVDAAWRRVGVAPAVPARRLRVPAGIAAGLVALLVVGLVAFTPTGRQAAADLLSGFRSERLQVVTFDPDRPLGDLDGLSDIVEFDPDRGGHSAAVAVDDLDDAAGVVGFVPTAPTSLPDGAELTDVEASAPSTATLTFRADHAPDLPAVLDGARLTVSVPGTVASMYDVDGRMLVVAEADELSVDATGAELGQIRDYLLSRPEVPDDLSRQLLAIDDWTTTLPIPVPVDRVVWQETTVAGAPALMVSDPMGSGLLWHADGRIHAVGAEGLDIDAVRRIADGVS